VVPSLAALLLWPVGPALAQGPAEDGEPTSCCVQAGRAGALLLRTAAQPAADQSSTVRKGSSAGSKGMVWIRGGELSMGSTDPLARRDERPVHRVRVDGFWMDATEVTNAQFEEFVKATGYKTVAERPIDWEELKKQVAPGTPKPPAEKLLPGSMVFTPPDHPVDLRAYEQWWTWTTGADWRHPQGPASTIEGKDNFPVVQVAFEDAIAYCKWAGKTLPTEAQWEFAARGGLDHKVNGWGDEPVDPKRCNIWQGHFPDKNTAEDGFAGAAPVKSFPPNGYGLYDMAGNVWEWCSDLYRPDTYALRVAELGATGVAVNPTGPAQSFDPRNPHSETRVQRGGSFLCNDSYCASYRPSARMACPPDTGMQHLGFRCVMAAKPGEKHEIEAAASPSALDAKK
jgi:formylglycine-generating enzyme required for sulfatase activity